MTLKVMDSFMILSRACDQVKNFIGEHDVFSMLTLEKKYFLKAENGDKIAKVEIYDEVC